MAMYEPFNEPDTVLARLKNTGANAKRATLGAFDTAKTAAMQGANDFKAMPFKQKLGATLTGASKFGTALTPILEANNTYNDITTDGMQTSDKIARGAEGVSRAAGSIAGGALGAGVGSAIPVVGTAIGGALGATAGYLAPDAVKNVSNALGADIQLPSDKAASLRSDAQANANALKNTLTGNRKEAAKAPQPEDDAVQVLDGAGNLIGMQKPLTQGGSPINDAKKQADPFANVDKQRQQLASTLLSKDAGAAETSFKAQSGYEPLNVNATAQDLVNQALQSVNQIKNPANAPTLGDAFAQKIANRQITEKANMMAKTADQLNNLATGSIGMRQGEQKLVQGDVNIDQERQNLIRGDVDIQGGKQKLQVGQNELDRSAQLKATLEEYANPETKPERRKQLADLALTLQGKEPANRFDVESVTDKDGVKTLYKIDKKTGSVSAVENQPATPQYQDGELVTLPDGRVKKYNASTNTLDNP